MDEEKILIIVKGEDKTEEIEYYLIRDDDKVNIKFYNCGQE